MKIEYINKQPTKTPTLAELKSGEVFRPMNSHIVYMCCDLSGESRLLSERASDIWEYVALVGDEPFVDRETFAENHDYDELIVCISLTSGNVVLLYQDIEVERVNCKLLVEGE